MQFKQGATGYQGIPGQLQIIRVEMQVIHNKANPVPDNNNR